MYNKGVQKPPKYPILLQIWNCTKNIPYKLSGSGDQTTNTHVVMTIYIGRRMLAITNYVEIVLNIGLKSDVSQQFSMRFSLNEL